MCSFEFNKDMFSFCSLLFSFCKSMFFWFSISWFLFAKSITVSLSFNNVANVFFNEFNSFSTFDFDSKIVSF